MLQALFNKIWIDNEGVIDSEFTEIYKNLVGPIEKDIAQRNKKSAPDNSDADFPDRLLKSYSKFLEKGLNNELLVEHRGVEPLTSTMRMSRANIVFVLTPQLLSSLSILTNYLFRSRCRDTNFTIEILNSFTSVMFHCQALLHPGPTS